MTNWHAPPGHRRATAVKKRQVAVDVLAPGRPPAGATARVRLVFTTAGDIQKRVPVHGRLFLTRRPGTWQIFGYDVAKGGELMRRRILRQRADWLTLGVVLGVVTLVLPDSAVKPTEFALVKVDQGNARRPRHERHLDPGRRLRRPARRGLHPHPRRRPAADRRSTPRPTRPSVIGVPRDSWVDIPGHGLRQDQRLALLRRARS